MFKWTRQTWKDIALLCMFLLALVAVSFMANGNWGTLQDTQNTVVKFAYYIGITSVAGIVLLAVSFYLWLIWRLIVYLIKKALT